MVHISTSDIDEEKIAQAIVFKVKKSFRVQDAKNTVDIRDSVLSVIKSLGEEGKRLVKSSPKLTATGSNTSSTIQDLRVISLVIFQLIVTLSLRLLFFSMIVYLVKVLVNLIQPDHYVERAEYDRYPSSDKNSLEPKALN